MTVREACGWQCLASLKDHTKCLLRHPASTDKSASSAYCGLSLKAAQLGVYSPRAHQTIATPPHTITHNILSHQCGTDSMTEAHTLLAGIAGSTGKLLAPRASSGYSDLRLEAGSALHSSHPCRRCLHAHALLQAIAS